jgi:UDP-4-amino-4,6-dideoxy-N-acetyl-beta-L-altrosamine N-acetyltransferase
MLEYCQVRGMTFADLPMVLAWRNHTNVRRFMFSQHEISVSEHSQWFMRMIQDETRRLIIVEENAIPVGYVHFSNVAPGGIAEWGFYACPDAAKGTGRKLGTAALKYAFGPLRLHKVCGQALASNQASIKFHEGLGFTREAELRDQKRINDEYHTLIYFGMLAREWQTHSEGQM